MIQHKINAKIFFVLTLKFFKNGGSTNLEDYQSLFKNKENLDLENTNCLFQTRDRPASGQEDRSDVGDIEWHPSHQDVCLGGGVHQSRREIAQVF